METLIVKIKRLNENAVIPAYAHATDAGLDLVATSKTIDEYGNVVYGTGIALEIPEGYVGLVFPRSSNCKKHLLLTNSVGVIDSGYRGEVTFKYRPPMVVCYKKLKDRLARLLLGARRTAKCRGVDTETWHLFEYEVGDRVGQLIILPYPKVEFEEVEKLSDSDRGTGGYGSTGK